jgi:hypothetical protein
MGDGKFRHPRIHRSEKSVIHIDWAARPTWMAEFSSAPHVVLRITLVLFFNSVRQKAQLVICHTVILKIRA